MEMLNLLDLVFTNTELEILVAHNLPPFVVEDIHNIQCRMVALDITLINGSNPKKSIFFLLEV